MALPIAKWESDLWVSLDQNFLFQICLKTFKLIRNPSLQLQFFSIA